MKPFHHLEYINLILSSDYEIIAQKPGGAERRF